MCEDRSVSHWINVSLPLTLSLASALVAGRRVTRTDDARCPFSSPSIPSPLVPKRSSFHRDSIGSLMRRANASRRSSEKMRERAVVVGGKVARWLSLVARWKPSRVISFPLTNGLRNAAIVEYTAAKSDDLYRIDSGKGSRWDTRAFEISFGYRGWLLNVDGRCRIHLTHEVERRVSILYFVSRIFMKYRIRM